MNKKFSKILATLLALIMCMVSAVPTFAGTLASTEGSGKIEVSKNLIMNSDAGVPDESFSFKLSAYTKGGTYPLYNGIMNGVANSYSVTFDDESVVTNGIPSDPAGTATEGKKYATEKFVIDFTGVDFDNAGVYRYVISEDDVTPPYNISNDQTQYIDVYVEYALQDDGTYSKDLTIQGVFMHSDDSAIDPSVTPTKSSSFDNMYTTYDLTVKKQVSGNQASQDEYFEFTVSVTDCEVDDVYTVSTTSEYVTNPATIEVDGRTGTQTFHLKHGESFTIYGLPVGTKYTVSEVNGTYTATYSVDENRNISSGSGNEYKDGEDGITGDTTITFTNTRGGVIPTGILLTVAPFAALMVIGAAGVLFVVLKKKRFNA